MYLLDTMVVSEPTKTRPNPEVDTWLRSQPPQCVFMSVLSLGEVLFGIRRLPPGQRRTQLTAWHHESLSVFFAGRVLNIDHNVADVWAGMRAHMRRSLSPIDGLIAATALSHDLVLVTRNERHLAGLGVRVMNPWTA
jgi:hypothetical protein